jgi:protein-L-isoaspartate(D-aspartate) O-methyltransferase
MDEYAAQRAQMVEQQLRGRNIVDERVLQALAEVPRHCFVPEPLRHVAYEDRALPLEEGQTISQPYIVALMAQALELHPDDTVLEIGTGSGYAAAVLGRLARRVFSVERQPELARGATRVLRELGYHNVEVIEGDGTLGWPAYAPYDAIAVPAAAPWVPRPLREQLANGGRLVIPVGGANEQMLLVLRRSDNEITSYPVSGVRFVPLIGAHAWNDPPLPQRFER